MSWDIYLRVIVIFGRNPRHWIEISPDHRDSLDRTAKKKFIGDERGSFCCRLLLRSSITLCKGKKSSKPAVLRFLCLFPSFFPRQKTGNWVRRAIYEIPRWLVSELEAIIVIPGLTPTGFFYCRLLRYIRLWFSFLS